MKAKGTGREKWKRIAGGLAAGVLLFSLLIPGSLAEEKTEEDPDEFSAEYVLALDAVERLGITDGDGNPIEIRTDKVPRGRGYGSTETEPDYTGVIGYAVLSNDPDFCLAPVMASYRWMIPVYEDVDGKTGGQYGRISHKTPLLAVGQTLKQVRNRRYRGYVRVIRLDRQELCWINVNHFETVTYWNLKLSSACRYGYCLAVYREGSRTMPKDAEGKAVSLRDGTRVLVPYSGAVDGTSPDPDNLSLAGIVMRKEEGKERPYLVFFNEMDLIQTF